MRTDSSSFISLVLPFCTFILLIASRCYGQSCSYGDVRLVGGSGDYEGNVQVCLNNTWGYVCDNSWSTTDARVVCRELGYSYSTAYVKARSNSYFGSGDGTVNMDNLYCSYYNSRLIYCSRGSISCNPYTDIAGVTCIGGGNCTNGDIRLSSGLSSHGRSEGRVEVCHNSRWGSICRTSWTTTNTRVACSQLGYDSTYVYTYPSYSTFGSSYGSIVWSNVNCASSASSLSACSKTVGGSGCYLSRTAGIRCYGLDDTPCTNGAVRLWSAYNTTRPNEGIIQICRNSRWNAMCDTFYSSTCYVGKLVCKSLGYSGALILKSNAGSQYGYYYRNDNYRYSCYSYHSTLSQCSITYRSYCGDYNDALGVICTGDNSTSEETPTNECTNGDVRLVNGGSTTDNKGRVEYCYQGEWSPMCSLSTTTARLVCKKLGYKYYQYAAIDYSETFGTSNKRSVFNRLNCYSWHSSLSQCSVQTKSFSSYSQCYISSSATSACYTEYGLTCIEPVKDDCVNGSVRLADGQIEQEGRAEVCVDGIWSTICRSSWGAVDSYIFCKTLGYDGRNHVEFYYARFGRGNGFPAWNYVNCRGWEDDITECSKSTFSSCSLSNTVALRCKEDCKNGDIRLTGGPNTNEGTVEVCYNNLWGQISDSGWTNEDARVVCRYLGYSTKDAIAVRNSKYGMSNITIHLNSVRCVGNEYSINECAKTINSLYTGINLVDDVEVAGVDCVYDEPTEPPCISISSDMQQSTDSCTSKGSIRLVNKVSSDEGRVEYCNGQYWTPLCAMDNSVAAVVCGQLGYSEYQWGTILETDQYGINQNYSLVHNITCSGSESSISECTVVDALNTCLPWCPNRNIGLRCFTAKSAQEECAEGTVRLVDGIIEQEGRVEVCINGIWGAICDDAWDKTDAHVVCRQMGHPVLEPYIYKNSRFGDGQYPIVYSNVNCGGWEESIGDCESNNYLQTTCSRDRTAGVLCGYNCSDGDVRLVDGPSPNEGTVQVCFNSLWGLVDESGWSLSDAKVVCSQLGYSGEEKNMPRTGSYYGKSNLTVHLANVQCQGDEENIQDCLKNTYSLQEGKDKLMTVDVAGVRCSVPSGCVTPPTGGTECNNRDVRMSGATPSNSSSEGTPEYCHNGYWTSFCSLNEREATVVCRQLGYIRTQYVSIFTDGKFTNQDLSQYTSYIENVRCTSDEARDLTQCHIIDGCESSCPNPIGIKCFESVEEGFSPKISCEDGSIRLVDGLSKNEGRVELCLNNAWGTICGDNFEFADAFVICNTFSSGTSEPIVYTNSHFGDGSQPVLISNVKCTGNEDSLLGCDMSSYGSFVCSRQNIIGVKCKQDCSNGAVRLVGGSRETEGTVEVCYENVWGLIAAQQWDKRDASVICHQLGYIREGAISVTDSRYGKPNNTVLVANVQCSGSESFFGDCDFDKISIDNGRQIRNFVNVSGVSCSRIAPVVTTDTVDASVTPPQPNIQEAASADVGMSAALGIIVILLVAAVAIIIGMFAMFCIKKKKSSSDLSISSHPVSMSSVNPLESSISESPSFDEKIIPL